MTSRIRDEVQLRVIDAGPGIPPAAREHAFQPFQRQTDSGVMVSVLAWRLRGA